MSILSKGTTAYIYLNGIRPSEEMLLRNDITLLPSSCNPTPDAIIDKSKSEVDIGVACIFLRSVSASLHITASTPEELAAKAWNSQWDAILLGALYDCEIGFNFQSDVAPENFHQAQEFHVMNYAFKGLNSGQIRTLNGGENHWLKDHYRSAWQLMDEDRYQNAIHCLASYRWHSMPRAQLALIWSGIEGLFQIDYELSFRLDTGKHDDELLKSALLLAGLDPIFRAGVGQEYIGLIDDQDVQDLRNLISATDFQIFKAEKYCLLNPSFGKASSLVGGADADLVIDGTIIDIKTAKKLELTRDYINQLIGYYTLYTLGGVNGERCSPEISKLAIYFARYAYLHVIEINEIISQESFPYFVKWFEERASQDLKPQHGHLH